MKKILVVDDEPDIVELIKSRLESENYLVVTASDGREGVQKAQSEQPDLILMDVLMPNMTGGDAVRVIKSSKDTAQIPIMFITGVYSDNSEGKEYKGINVAGEYYGSIAKPFKSENLLSKVYDCLQNRN